jgi:hypothetical protein
MGSVPVGYGVERGEAGRAHGKREFEPARM